MNAKAEKFQDFLKENELNFFTMEENDDELSTVIFRGQIETAGQTLPMIAIVDTSYYSTMRVLVAPKAVRNDNRLALDDAINAQNAKYKICKFYLDGENNLIMDSCLMSSDDDFNAETFYSMLQSILPCLEEFYPQAMDSIWSK